MRALTFEELDWVSGGSLEGPISPNGMWYLLGEEAQQAEEIIVWGKRKVSDGSGDDIYQYSMQIAGVTIFDRMMHQDQCKMLADKGLTGLGMTLGAAGATIANYASAIGQAEIAALPLDIETAAGAAVFAAAVGIVVASKREKAAAAAGMAIGGFIGGYIGAGVGSQFC